MLALHGKVEDQRLRDCQAAPRLVMSPYQNGTFLPCEPKKSPTHNERKSSFAVCILIECRNSEWPYTWMFCICSGVLTTRGSVLEGGLGIKEKEL